MSDMITSGLEMWGKARDAATEAFFFNTYGSPILQAMVGLRADETSVSRRIGRDVAREAAAKQAAAHLEQQIDQGGLIEAAVRALIYVRLPEGKVDERGFAALKQISAELPAAKRVGFARFKEIVKEQYLILLMDAERAIAALPQAVAGQSPAVRRGAGIGASRPRCARRSARRGPPQARAHRGDVRRSAPGGRPGQGGLGRREMGQAMETKADGPRERYDRLVRAAQQLPPVTTAVAHPCDQISIEGVVEAAKLGLIAPILVGPPARIREAAEQAEADISSFPLEESAHSHDSAAKAVELVRQGKAEALMKGSLHTDELMGAVVARETGIRTARRISHCFVMDVPGHKDPLIITDAAVNIAPSLADKVDIVQNAIDLGHALGFPEVRVAIMSAMETVNPAVPSTIEAAALCKMAERGQITGGILDGPLALDNAINEEAAAIKHIVSPVAGHANVLVVPDLEAGNMLAKSLSFLAGAAAAGIVLGARVPIILTSRADSVITRLASCAVASLVAEARRRSAAAAIR